jgi:hypothetical protein
MTLQEFLKHIEASEVDGDSEAQLRIHEIAIEPLD